MHGALSRKRPWLAALLSALATGLGHLYLRRWRRGLGWLVGVFAVSVLFVDPAALEALATGSAVDPVAVAPVLLVAALSTVDAYLLAQAHNAVAAMAVAGSEQATRCPNCRRELDPDLDFCHWCNAELPQVHNASHEAGEGRQD